MTAAVFAGLVRAYRAGHAVAACRYADAAGVPALFARGHFPALLALPAGEGAKRLMRAAGPGLSLVDFPGGAANVDTPADYRRRLGADGAADAGPGG